MTAGAGIYHDESLPDAFMAQGGTSEIIQLWLNLPPALKDVPPRYQAAEASDLPVRAAPDGSTRLAIVAGEQDGTAGPIESMTGASVAWVTAAVGGRLFLEVPEGRIAIVYISTGRLQSDGVPVGPRTLLAFTDGQAIELPASAPTSLIFCHADPIDAPVMAEGPFVMNTREELQQAFEDFGSGRVSSGALT